MPFMEYSNLILVYFREKKYWKKNNYCYNYSTKI